MRESNTLNKETEIDKEISQKNGYKATNVFTFALGTLFILMLLMTFVFRIQIITVHGNSMYPTLKSGENYLSYSPSLLTHIKKNDIIVFNANKVDDNMKMNNPNANNNTQYIKRVIAVPGDSVRFYKNNIYVNGKEINQDYLEPHNYAGTKVNLSLENILPTQSTEWNLVSLSNMQSSESGKTSWNKYSKNLTINKVPPHCYFVLGDNRTISNDSRYYGFVPQQAIEGVLIGTHQQKRS